MAAAKAPDRFWVPPFVKPTTTTSKKRKKQSFEEWEPAERWTQLVGPTLAKKAHAECDSPDVPDKMFETLKPLEDGFYHGSQVHCTGKPSEGTWQKPAPPKVDVLETQETDQEAACPVCLEKGVSWRLGTCDHAVFCSKECADQYVQHSDKCPKCQKRFQLRTGPCPPGKAGVLRYDASLPGHPGCGHYVIEFDMQGGTQQRGRDYHPGNKYERRSVDCYLPDTQKGRHVGSMMMQCWRRGHLFKVGYSLTRNKDDKIVFADVHLKTVRESTEKNPFGYPDAGYLHRVEEELALKGFVA